MNDADSSPIDGIAERSGDHITVKLKQPEAKTFTLDGTTVFPTEQIQRIIAAAREGKSVLELTVYDGSDNGEKVYNTLSVIGQPIPGDRSIASPDPSTANDVMKPLTRWPVTVSYYDRDAKAKDGEQTPVYRCRSSCSRTASRGRWCWTTMISSSPARWANSTSRIPSPASEAQAERLASFFRKTRLSSPRMRGSSTPRLLGPSSAPLEYWIARVRGR